MTPQRIAMADQTIDWYARVYRLTDDRQAAFSDLITDLLLAAHVAGLDTGHILSAAVDNYRHEIEEHD